MIVSKEQKVEFENDNEQVIFACLRNNRYGRVSYYSRNFTNFYLIYDVSIMLNIYSKHCICMLSTRQLKKFPATLCT